MTEKQYYRVKAVSASSLKWFEISPQLYRKKLDEEIVEEKKRFLEIGKKVHMAILEPDEFEKNYIYLDYQQPKSPQQKLYCDTYVEERKKNPKATMISCKIKAYSLAYANKTVKDDDIKKRAVALHNKLKNYINYLEKTQVYKDVLTKADWELVKGLKQAVLEHKLAPEVLGITQNKTPLNGDFLTYSELPIFWEYPEYKVKCKSMIDRLVIDKEDKIIRLLDLKTTFNIGDFKTHIDEFKYYRQLAYYWMAVHWWLKEERIVDNIDEYKIETYIIALHKKDVLECRVIPIPESKLNEGLAEIARLIPKIAWHIENDKWLHTKEYYEGSGIENLY